MPVVYTRPPQNVKVEHAFEVYKTDEENFIPYTPQGGSSGNEEDEDSEAESLEIKNEEDGFILHQGEIVSTTTLQNLTNASWDGDYADINNNGSASLPEIKELDKIYKGVRCLLKASWNDEDDLKEILLSFITGETFTENGMELTLAGMTKLLEQNYEFSFTQMKRSKIVEEIIKTAGLEPVVNVEGLVDEVIDYTNVSSGSDDGGDVDNSNLPADACAFAKKLTKGKKGKTAKAQVIYNWIDTNMKYSGYNNSHFNEQNIYADVKSHLGERRWNCCDHAHMGVVLLRCAGIKANYVHGPGHVWVVAYLESGKVMFDPLGYQNRKMGQVWRNLTGTEMESIGF